VISRLGFIVALIACGTAIAQVPSGSSTYLGSGQSPLSDPFFIYPYELNAFNPPFKDTTGYTSTSCALVGGETTAVIIFAGQSNANNTVNSSYTVTQSRNHQMNIFDGLCYQSKGIMLGVGGSAFPPTGYSSVIAVLADKLISDAHYQRVIAVPIAVDGASSADWSTPKIAPYIFNSIAVAARRLAAQGLTATHVQWMQGETDCLNGVSQSTYAANLNLIIAGFRNAGISAPFLVNEESWFNGSTCTAIQNAQVAASGTNVFPAANLDSIGAGSRWDNTHFTSAGAATAAGLMEAQIILH